MKNPNITTLGSDRSLSKKPIISLKNISFSYDNKTNVLQDVSFDVYENEYVCIIGHNGSGKSTISKILVGLLKPKNGYFTIYDEVVSYLNLHYLRKNVGIIFQNPDSQFIGLTTRDDIVFGLENRKINPKYMDQIIRIVTKIIGIEKLLDQSSASLSGGQKQKVAIASVLATDPNIIIFDESTSMLDPKGKTEIKNIMLELKHKTQKTVISITHDMDEVLAADRVIVFKKGKIATIGSPKEVFSDAVFLQNAALDFPFILKLAQSLQDYNVRVCLTSDKTDLITQICQWKKSE